MWKNNGFTLIEILVATGVLAAILAGVINLIGPGTQNFARDTRRQSDLENISSSLEMYRNDNTTYPPCPGAAASCNPSTIAGAPAFSGYMNPIPTDPRAASGRVYTYRPFDVGGGACSGTAADRCVTYSLCAALEKITTAVAGNPACGSCGGGFTCSHRVRNP